MFGSVCIKYKNNFLVLLLLVLIICNFSKPCFAASSGRGVDKKHILFSAATGALLLGGIALIDQIEQQHKQEALDNYNQNRPSNNTDNKDNSKSPANIAGNNIHNEASGDKSVLFKDVAGLQDKLKDVTEVVDFIKHPERFTRLGAEMPRGILLEGPPGNGKTLIAKAIANEASCSFYNVSASTLMLKYVGEGPNAVKEVFANARANAPAILFFDEVDAVGTRRGSGQDEERRRTLTQILTEMDGFSSNDKIIVIAATNTADDLDPALLRRFTRKIHIPNPNKESRRDILNYYINKLPKLDRDVKIDYLVDNTEGFSGADLQVLKNEAVMFAARSNSNLVSFKHFKEALDKELERRKRATKDLDDLIGRFGSLNLDDKK